MFRRMLFLSILSLCGCISEDGEEASLSLGRYQGPTDYSDTYKYIPILTISSKTDYVMGETEYRKTYLNGSYSEDYPERTMYCETKGTWEMSGDSLVLQFLQHGCVENGGMEVTDTSTLTLDNVPLADRRHAIPIRNVAKDGFDLAEKDSIGMITWRPWLKLK